MNKTYVTIMQLKQFSHFSIHISHHIFSILKPNTLDHDNTNRNTTIDNKCLLGTLISENVRTAGKTYTNEQKIQFMIKE